MSSDISDFEGADAIVGRHAAHGGQPGIAYGIVRGGELVHAAGFGERWLGGPAPDAETVFRIASMSKSFTASAVLLLRDAGRLALDDPAEKYVPELAAWPPVTPDAERVTIRHLLAMTAGFPTDDPWGDRQQGLPPEEFGELLAGGMRFNWAPGTRFEYSNLGYAILGRVITAASGLPYPEFVRSRLLAPLGMDRTGYEAAEFAGEGVALGYRRGPDGWRPVPFDPCGAFAPMGGVFSCVRDLARWVAGFAAAFPPGGAGPAGAGRDGDAHPLRAASRREMQLPRVPTGGNRGFPLPGTPPLATGGYGFGLFAEEHPVLGRLVGHSGGYPGFGSNMRWHPATGTGVIALGNATYAGMASLTAAVLEAIVGDCLASAAPGTPSPQVALAPAAGPWPETLAAREAVSGLLKSWDDAAADALFTPNVALDSPYEERRRAIALLAERIGDFADSAERPPESDTPAHCRWFLAGERGTAQAQILLSPTSPPRVQALTLAVPPAADSPLARALEAVVAWMNAVSSGAVSPCGSAPGSSAPGSNGPAWPASVPVAEGVDVSLLSRRLRMAAAWAGPCVPGACRAGDGSSAVTVELSGEHATILLALAADPATDAIRAADVIL